MQCQMPADMLATFIANDLLYIVSFSCPLFPSVYLSADCQLTTVFRSWLTSYKILVPLLIGRTEFAAALPKMQD